MEHYNATAVPTSPSYSFWVFLQGGKKAKTAEDFEKGRRNKLPFM